MLPGRRFRWMGGMLRGEQKTEDRGQTAGDRNRPLFCRSQAALGMRPAKRCFALSDSPPNSGFASPEWIRQAELGRTHSQAELGNDGKLRGIEKLAHLCV